MSPDRPAAAMSSPLAEVAEQVDRSDRSLACGLGSSGRVDVVAEMAR